ncbi:gluconate 2-dehydrogenase subunit 3 family protein [Paraburkholderia xenovorans]|uniref:gluconate 2-dehydrogenase subunit 3 family protein n=1 Tax=Paraburkholderia xenovorans TaxID=36873 RepID=UPI0038B7DE2D
MTAIQDETGRRRFLRQVATIIPASSLTPALLAQQGCSESAKPDGENSAGVMRSAEGSPYRPTFFTDSEWKFLIAAVDELIPSDSTGAGAVEAGVPEFIDRQMQTPYAHGHLWYMHAPFNPASAPELGYQMKFVPRDIYRIGIQECDAWCESTHKRVFAELGKALRIQFLEQIDDGKIELQTVPAKLFFSTLLKNTKEGYFADPMYGGNRGMAGWKMIGFPGARADFMDWVGKPGARYPLPPVSILGEQS